MSRAAGGESSHYVTRLYGASTVLWQTLRVHQWLKNLLLAVPLLAAHRVTDAAAWVTLLLSFVAFSLCASAVYIANDLLDLEHDRRHPRKRLRPFAAGTLSTIYGVAMLPVLCLLSARLAWVVGARFTACLVLYVVIATLYSLTLKRLAIVDVLTLAALYTLRIVAGAMAVSLYPSFWLLAFSVFLFVSLAFVKRFAELKEQPDDTRSVLLPGRGYLNSDAPVVFAVGIAAGYAAVLVMALYVHGESVRELYDQPELIWVAVPLVLYWVTRIWLMAHRGKMHDDPLLFAVTDRGSWAVGVLFVMAIVLADFGLPM
jgi:4-hydroxybenzoate polyprenyltransferase